MLGPVLEDAGGLGAGRSITLMITLIYDLLQTVVIY